MVSSGFSVFPESSGFSVFPESGEADSPPFKDESSEDSPPVDSSDVIGSELELLPKSPPSRSQEPKTNVVANIANKAMILFFIISSAGKTAMPFCYLYFSTIHSEMQ